MTRKGTNPVLVGDALSSESFLFHSALFLRGILIGDPCKLLYAHVSSRKAQEGSGRCPVTPKS